MKTLLLGFALSLAGCGGAAPACDAETPCPFGEDCVSGACVPATCASSDQCGVEERCVDRACVPGCDNADDCYPGFTCEEHACAEAACEETAVDCGFKEFCNPLTGECYDAGGDYCRPCGDASDCADGNECFLGYCLQDCSGGRECPAAFECYPFDDGAGNVVFLGCFTYCWLYDSYDPDAFSSPVTP
ncbi:MAG: hypothetical protein JXX28_04145 [Deltaproteobacteria bacterium]|nr:hypothetical protein [Deltaproteobacteria bacterium]